MRVKPIKSKDEVPKTLIEWTTWSEVKTREREKIPQN